MFKRLLCRWAGHLPRTVSGVDEARGVLIYRRFCSRCNHEIARKEFKL